MGVSRRSLLAGGAGAALLSGGTWVWLRERGYTEDPPPTRFPRALEPRSSPALVPLSGPPFDPRSREAIAALYGHLLPGDPGRGIPSADEARVFEYVERAARVPGLRPLRNEILKLARYLDQRSAPERFSTLDAARATQIVLDTQEDTRPRGRFVPAQALEAALRLGLEGYLGHPEHGGNPGFIVWEALAIAMPKERSPLTASPTHAHGSGGE